jgi:predicted dinucleotide-binding enzyme
MRIGVLGTGIVGNTIGTALVAGGHDVRMGSRSATNPKAADWVESCRAATHRGKASQGTFADAAAFGEVLFNCTAGAVSLEALGAAGRDNLRGRILIDLSNPLDFSNGMPPTLTICNTDSLGERIQAAFPEARVVKTLNTINCQVMVDPRRVPGDHVIFLSGNDAAAKQSVARLLDEWFGWQTHNVVDLGDITTARGTEMMLPLWIRLMAALGSADFNFNLVRSQPRARPAYDAPVVTVH